MIYEKILTIVDEQDYNLYNCHNNTLLVANSISTFDFGLIVVGLSHYPKQDKLF